MRRRFVVLALSHRVSVLAIGVVPWLTSTHAPFRVCEHPMHSLRHAFAFGSKIRAANQHSDVAIDLHISLSVGALSTATLNAS